MNELLKKQYILKRCLSGVFWVNPKLVMPSMVYCNPPDPIFN
jgi:hypothetical protein